MVKNASPILVALQAATASEQAAVEFMEQHRWKGNPACPRCGSVNVYKMTSATGERNKDYRWRCRDCAGTKMFSVRTSTIFEESRLPMRVWVFAFWRAATSKKGCSALELSRQMQITHKSALFVLRRIRHGISDVNAPKLTGVIEADEVYLGGKQRGVLGRPGVQSNKTPVVGVVQRGGDVRLRMMQRITSDGLSKVLAENADRSCRLMTDDYFAYRRVGQAFKSHEVVKHSAGEYARGDVHSNTIEGVFSLIRRGVMGTFHSISRKHLPNYLDEFQFRWNTRKMDDGERVAAAIRKVDGKRLQYRESVDNPPYLAPWFKEPIQAKAPL